MNSNIKVELCDEVRNILTEKESKIILSLLQGHTVTDIAVATCRDIRTISTQKKSAYKKLNVKNDVSLIVKLLENRYARIAYPEHQ